MKEQKSLKKSYHPQPSKEVQELRMRQGPDATRKTQLRGVAFFLWFATSQWQVLSL